jgi:uncharacterized protein YggE
MLERYLNIKIETKINNNNNNKNKNINKNIYKLFSFIITISFSILFTNNILSCKVNSLSTNTNLKSSRIFLRPFGKIITVEHLLRSQGKSIYTIDQDFILISIEILTIDKNIQKSYEDNFLTSKKFDEILRSLKIIDNQNQKNIKTISYEMMNKYKDVYNEDTKKFEKIFEGFEISNKIEIKLKDLRIASDLIQRSVNLGNSLLITSVQFDIDRINSKKYEEKILIEATENALKKAEIVSKTLKVNLDDVNNIDVNLIYPEKHERKINYNYAVREASMDIGGVELFSGKDKIEGIVYVSFLTLKN